MVKESFEGAYCVQSSKHLNIILCHKIIIILHCYVPEAKVYFLHWHYIGYTVASEVFTKHWWQGVGSATVASVSMAMFIQQIW